MKYLCHNLAEMADVAHSFLAQLKLKPAQANLVCLSGDLGSGKTAFTKLVAEELNIKETITSPTFVIEKKYEIKDHPFFRQMIHIDAYRLNDGQDLLKLDWLEIINEPSNLILLEWPEIVSTILPKDSKTINFLFIDESTREIDLPDFAP